MSGLARISFCVLIFVTFGSAALGKNEGIFDKIKAGLRVARNYFETVKDVADLVAKSLNQRQKEERGDEGGEESGRKQFGTPNIISAFFRLLGLDSKKVAAIAVNSVIFLAQMISSLFDLPPAKPNVGNEARDSNDNVPPYDPLKYIMDNRNEKLQDLISQAQDSALPDRLMENLDGFDSACVRLFLCKVTPAITAAQKSLKNNTHGGFRKLTSWLPSKKEYEDNSDKCEDEYTDCSLFPDS